MKVLRESESKSAAPLRQRLAIADKNPVVRTGLAEIIARDGRFEVAAAVATGAAFLDLAAGGTVDLGIIGWALPDMTGGDVLLALKKAGSPLRAIIYTGEPGLDVVRRSIKSGAWGFISKSDEPPVILDAIASVARGRVSFPFVDIDALTKDPLDTLTLRERELLGALANGWSNLQIAARFGISRNTVKYHLKNLYDRLGVNNRAMAVALYVGATGKREGH